MILEYTINQLKKIYKSELIEIILYLVKIINNQNDLIEQLKKDNLILKNPIAWKKYNEEHYDELSTDNMTFEDWVESGLWKEDN